MTREQIEREIEDLEAYLRFKQDGIDQLNAKYSGVRPAWVSGDIGWDMMHMDNARSKIKELKERFKIEPHKKIYYWNLSVFHHE